MVPVKGDGYSEVVAGEGVRMSVSSSVLYTHSRQDLMKHMELGRKEPHTGGLNWAGGDEVL